MQNVSVTAVPEQTLGDPDYVMSEERETEVPVADPAVMARFKIIKSRMDITEPKDQSNAERSVEENITMQKNDGSLASNGDEVPHVEVDSDVMARLRILKKRGDVGLTAESVLPNYYSLRFATEPRDLHPQAGSSEWEHVLRDELSPPGNNHMNG
jgi:hypothetical protein